MRDRPSHAWRVRAGHGRGHPPGRPAALRRRPRRSAAGGSPGPFDGRRWLRRAGCWRIIEPWTLAPSSSCSTTSAGWGRRRGTCWPRRSGARSWHGRGRPSPGSSARPTGAAPADVQRLLERLGDPRELAARERQRLDASASAARRPTALADLLSPAPSRPPAPAGPPGPGEGGVRAGYPPDTPPGPATGITRARLRSVLALIRRHPLETVAVLLLGSGRAGLPVPAVAHRSGGAHRLAWLGRQGQVGRGRHPGGVHPDSGHRDRRALRALREPRPATSARCASTAGT